MNPKKQKESKPAKQPQKKETPKKEKKKETKDEEEDEEQVAAKPKVDPLAKLPQTSFNFDAFKREYSNKDTVSEAIPYFWEHFDKENCSIWHCVYKYPEDLKLVFMASNLVGGMLQRIDGLRKVGFASMLILGENGAIAISGVWVFRGQTLGFELSEDFQIDSPSYEFRKLDPDNEADKKLFNEYLAWEGDFCGKPVADGKIFK